MKTVGIIIGTETGWISDGYYKKNRKKLRYLDTLDSSILYKSDAIPYDYAILCEFKALEKKFKVNVVPLHGPTLNLESANECDFIFCIYEAVFSFMDGGYKGYNNYMNVLSKTKATVHPPVKVQKFIINKQEYMGWLKKLGIDIIPTKFINITSYNTNKKKTLESIYNFAEKGSYKELIMKPELGAFAGGFKHYKRITDKSMISYFDKVSKKGYKKVLVQPYIPEFLKYYEIKTFWLNGKYLYAYGINVIGEKDDVYPEADGGTLPDEYVNSCRKTGEKIIKELFKEYGSLAELRIDFGCCIDNDNLCRDYFVNEIEVLPTIIDDETKKDNFRLLAKTVLERV
jgi:hypothetical protein